MSSAATDGTQDPRRTLVLLAPPSPSSLPISFEPNPAAFACLKANAEAWGSSVTCLPFGVSSEEKTAELTFFEGLSLLSGSYADTAQCVDWQTIEWDDYWTFKGDEIAQSGAGLTAVTAAVVAEG